MFTVKKKPRTPNIIWDAENSKPLCKFIKGKLETNDEALVEKLTAIGCEVSGEADNVPVVGDGGTKEPENTDTPTEGENSLNTGSEDGKLATVETPVEPPKTDTSTATTKRRSRK